MTLMESPIAAAMPPMMPSAGDSTVALILSVSNSAMGSPALTVSPSATSQDVMIPSSMVMPINGMSTGVAIEYLSCLGRRFGGVFR